MHPRVEKIFRLRRRHERAAIPLAHVAVLKMEEVPGLAIERRRHGAPARHEQNILRGHQRPLRRHAAERRCAVRLPDELRARAVIHPHHLPARRVQRVNERPHERPDARREIHPPVAHHRPAARRPRRDHALIAEHLPIRRPAAEFPEQPSLRHAHAIEIPVIAREINFVLPPDRREPHRAVRVERPQFRAAPQIQRHQLVRVIETDEHPPAQHHRLEDLVVWHQIVIQRVVPHLHARRIRPRPLAIQLRRQNLRRGRRAIRIKPPHRPVRRAHRYHRERREHRQKKRQPSCERENAGAVVHQNFGGHQPVARLQTEPARPVLGALRHRV